MKLKKPTFADVIIAIGLFFFTVIMIYPLLYELFASFSEPSQFVKFRGLLLKPLGFTLDAYKIVFSTDSIWIGFRNTLFVMAVGLCINLVLTSLAAYFLSRKSVLFHKPIMLFILITMYFSGGLAPFYLTVRGLHLYNSIWSIILPGAINTYNVILLRSYFATIPDSLAESVQMDGGGHITILTRIIIPLSKPAMMVMILYYGVGHWNSWFNAMLFLKDPNKHPLQLVLRNMLKEDSKELQAAVQLYDNYEMMEENIKAAMVIVATIPFLIIYPLLQKHFESGMMIGSLKE